MSEESKLPPDTEGTLDVYVDVQGYTREQEEE